MLKMADKKTTYKSKTVFLSKKLHNYASYFIASYLISEIYLINILLKNKKWKHVNDIPYRM